MRKKKILFVASDFVESQYLWLLPIIDGFLQNKNIKNLIFEKKLSKKILKEAHIKNFLKKYNIVYLDENKYLRLLKILKYIILNFKTLIYKLLNFKNLINIKNNKDWFQFQINHGIWDYVNLKIDENNLRKKLYFKFISIIISLEKIYLVDKLIKNYNLKYAFLGHTVYASRSLIASLRINDVKVFTHASFNIHEQKKFNDVNWGDIDLKKFNYIRKNKNFKIDSNNYWLKRISGKGSYEDSKIASINLSTKPLIIKNFIFLHIFRDSPFNTIDKKRIFVDYFDWIDCTLKIVSKSEENWEFRFHPSHKRWGENQNKIFNNLLNKNCKLNKKNVFVNYSQNSNNEIFKNANKVITFSGTSQYEAVAHGLKPIVISNSPLLKINKNIVFNPSSISQYQNLILKKDYRDFRHSKNTMNIAKDVIYFREKILRIKDMISGIDTYRNDSPKIISNNYRKTKEGVIKNYNSLLNAGKNLSRLKTIYSNVIKKYLR